MSTVATHTLTPAGHVAPPMGSTALLLAAFRRAATVVPAYRCLLEEGGIDPSSIVDLDTFADRCPILTKANTFDRFSIDQLCAEGTLKELADVLTSSGHGGRFSFGLTTRRQQAEAAAMIDLALDDAFSVVTKKTLAINCLPMGVVFGSKAMTVATTSVREDMAVALIKAFGHHYEQILIVSDPLFVRRLLDHAAAEDIDWSSYRVGLVLGEEIFGEQFRSYVANRLEIDLESPDGGCILSSFGVGELGLHLAYETRATIALRRIALKHPALAAELFGETGAVPMVLAYNPYRTLIEAVDPDSSGYGRLTISMLDTGLPVPLLRYQTGDDVRLIDSKDVEQLRRTYGIELPGPLPERMLALRGRSKEKLPDGSYLAACKDALYSDARVADRLTGAFRLTMNDGLSRVHVQLVRGAQSDVAFEYRLTMAVQAAVPGAEVVASSYESFPYGMSLDYERKFAYYAATAP